MSKVNLMVSIIGTAGRREDGSKLTSEILHRAIDKTKEIIKDKFKLSLEQVHLVSGGAAWMDHIAVSLFLQGEVSHLMLHFPCTFENSDRPQFTDNGIKDWTKNPGRATNIYHRKFSAKIKDDSLQQIRLAILVGAAYKEYKGFHDRNSKVAESRYLIAFTWDDTDIPKKGGTRDTWDKCQGKKIHIPLSSLMTQSSPVTSTGMQKQATPVTKGKTTCKGQSKQETHIQATLEVEPDIRDQSRIIKRKSEPTYACHGQQLLQEDKHVRSLYQYKRSLPDLDIVEESPPTKKADSSFIIYTTDEQRICSQ